ncbi:glycosyl transferase [Lichtheimia hyalospora FSU 10163]|nr:glycosyl transferase [Lichtheimia hyalospora FSU 10163]
MIVAYFFLPADVNTTPSTANRGGRPITNLNELTADDFLRRPVQQQAAAVQAADPNRVKAAFVILARNSDLTGVRYAMRQMEDRFNHKFNYPYVFLNEQDFTAEFKKSTKSLTKADTFYGKIDPSMWSYPSHINETYAAECRQDMENRNIIYGGSESYRHMCRFQSGFFFRHPLLDNFEYYWRVEPDVQYFCDIDYDVFQMMKDNQYKYGWTVSLTEYPDTIPTLWETTQAFMRKYPEYIIRGPDSLLPWITDDGYLTYNGCHFWSNFEIGSLDFLRSKKYVDYFEHLDQTGGFFYERWGDAPVHSLAVAMMLRKDEVHFFNDIGYMHNPLMHCPIEPYLQSKCHCNARENFDWEEWSCATRYRERLDPKFVWDEFTYNNKTAPYRITAI